MQQQQAAARRPDPKKSQFGQVTGCMTVDLTEMLPAADLNIIIFDTE